MRDILEGLPKPYREDIRRAKRILIAAGCREVLLFGSLVEGEARDGSDIDLAVRGCPAGAFYELLGKLLVELDHPVDLVRLDADDQFARRLESEGQLFSVS
jgi:predicted nucleotidyltransferase